MTIRRALISLTAITAAAFNARAEAILIRNATVLTVTKGTVQNGNVLIQDGKIAAIGKDISGPADATVVDATGKFLMPGIIDCHSHTAIEGGVNEGTVSDSSMVSVERVIPSGSNIRRWTAFSHVSPLNSSITCPAAVYIRLL